MSNVQRFDFIEVDLNGNGQDQPQTRVQILPPGRTLQQVVVTHIPPDVDVSLHFGGQGRPFRIQRQGDTFEFFDEAERDDGIYWSSEGHWPGYIIELAVAFKDPGTTAPPAPASVARPPDAGPPTTEQLPTPGISSRSRLG